MLQAKRLPWVMGAAIAGAVGLGLGAPRLAQTLDVGGEIFLRLLKLLVVPLVMSSVMSGILSLQDVRKLRRPGTLAVGYYLATTLLAVGMGILCVDWIAPGRGGMPQDALQAKEFAAPAATDLGTVFKQLALMLVTDNLVAAMAKADLLPLIAFSILFACVLTVLGDKVHGLKIGIVQLNEAMLAFVLMIMKVAPLGVFCLVAARFGEAQLQGNFGQVLAQTGWYVLTVLVGLAAHAFGVLAALLWGFTGRHPYHFMGQMAPALLTAFSTASSAATLPVTLESAVDRARVARQSAELVIPLGATVNMDGTALYEAVAAIFIAQLELELSFLQQMTVALTATLAAIGAAGIPEAGLVTLVMVLGAVGLPVDYLGILLPVDWLLDRFRTAVNVWGDCVGAALVEKAFPTSVQPDSSQHS
ncbi:dicarboxylate/amino acid:cation symporter [Methylothermus subterraneus]